MKTISKITRLKHIESYIQVNYLKGFKYIDRAGEILNLYQDNDGKIKFDISSERLVIPNPKNTINLLKISNVDIWCKFLNPSNLGSAKNDFFEEADKILDVLSVEKIVRIGWRNHFTYDLDDDNNFKEILKIDKAQLEGLFVKLQNDSVRNDYRINTIFKKDGGAPAILFDVDSYLKSNILKHELTDSLQMIKEQVQSKVFLAVINDVLKRI